MNVNWKKYQLGTLILAMLCLPLGLQAQGWRGQPGQGRMHGRMWMADSLNLSDQQKDQLETARQAFMKQMIQGQADLRVARLDLNNLIKGDGSDAQVNQQVQKVIQAQGALLEARTDHLLQVRKILGDELFNKWFQRQGRQWGMHGMMDGGWQSSPRGPMMRPQQR